MCCEESGEHQELYVAIYKSFWFFYIPASVYALTRLAFLKAKKLSHWNIYIHFRWQETTHSTCIKIQDINILNNNMMYIYFYNCMWGGMCVAVYTYTMQFDLKLTSLITSSNFTNTDCLVIPSQNSNLRMLFWSFTIT